MSTATLGPCPGCTKGRLMRYPDGEGECVGNRIPGPLGWIHTAPICGYVTPERAATLARTGGSATSVRRGPGTRVVPPGGRLGPRMRVGRRECGRMPQTGG